MLNRLRTSVGRFAATMKDWGLKDSAACDCGHPEQTVDHIIESAHNTGHPTVNKASFPWTMTRGHGLPPLSCRYDEELLKSIRKKQIKQETSVA